MQPRRGGRLEVDAAAPRDLDEREPAEVGTRERRTHEVGTGAGRRPGFQAFQVSAYRRARFGECSLVASLGRREERLARHGTERVAEVEHGLGFLDAYLRAPGGIRGQERGRWIALLEVFHDGRRLVEHEIAVGERGDLPMWMAAQVLGALVLSLLEAQQDGLVREPLLLEHELDAPRVR